MAARAVAGRRAPRPRGSGPRLRHRGDPRRRPAACLSRLGVALGHVHVQDFSEQPTSVRDGLSVAYGWPGQGHLHVHGANLGMSATANLDSGGIPPLTLAEDQALVDALRGRARRLVATGRIPVTTSGRCESRTVGGFADHLRALAR